MRCYASRTGNRRNQATLRLYGWGLMVGPGDMRTEGFDRIGADNGAWGDYQAGRAFDEDRYEKFLLWLERTIVPDFLVLPDIVADKRSLALSVRYLNRCRAASPLVLIAVQDGMEASDLAPLVGPGVGIFLGGSTEWKLARMRYWGEFCRERGIHYHVARVNTTKRMSLAVWAGADSIDGSSLSRYSVNAAKLTSASRYRDLFSSV